jgi:plasmid replication initiation protein
MTSEPNERIADTRECVRVVTSNDFLEIEGLCNLKLNSLKLLYFVISQCKKDDDKFYTCRITSKELSQLWGISKQRLHQEYDEIKLDLHNFSTKISKYNELGEEREYLLHIISMITTFLDSNKKMTTVEIEIDHNADKFFLHLDGNFSKPLLCDFNKMKSVNSILIWHLIQIKTFSKKPVNKQIKVKLSDIELRKLTGNLEKYSISHEFRRRVIDKAIKDIKKCCNVTISYKSIKNGKYIVGYEFILKNPYYIPEEKLSLRAKEAIKRADKINNDKLVDI